MVERLDVTKTVKKLELVTGDIICVQEAQTDASAAAHTVSSTNPSATSSSLYPSFDKVFHRFPTYTDLITSRCAVAHAPQFVGHWEYLWKTGEFADVEIEAAQDGKVFRAHKAVLCILPYFRKMFLGGMMESSRFHGNEDNGRGYTIATKEMDIDTDAASGSQSTTQPPCFRIKAPDVFTSAAVETFLEVLYSGISPRLTETDSPQSMMHLLEVLRVADFYG
ncbi:hypothetical protein HK102_012175, partial [Quaeritorhiza haematococci]